jgi:hypothetical protein
MTDKLSLREIYLQELYSLPKEWRIYSYKVSDDIKSRSPSGEIISRAASEFIGCIPDGVYKSGKRKGRPNYSKGTEKRTIILFEDEYRAWVEKYEITHNVCSQCFLSPTPGQEWVGWSLDNGNRFATCTRCNGTGKSHTVLSKIEVVK